MNRRTLAVALVVASAVIGLCACDDHPSSSAQSKGQADTEQAFAAQAAAVPYPKDQLTDSLERRDIAGRLTRTNKPNAIGYLYLFPPMGSTPIGYYVIKGKVTSTQSQMTTDQLIVWTCPGNVNTCDRNTMQPSVVNAPGDDGSYGPNEPGYYFTTADGVQVTTDLHYVLSDAPLPVHVPKFNAAVPAP